MKFIIYRDKYGKWRWHAMASNGKIVADSGQGYAAKVGLLKSLESFKEKALGAPIVVAK